MPSERRLHPLSVLFAFLAQIRAFILPGLLVLIGASSRGSDAWQPWMMALVIPNALVAVIRYFSYRYRYDPNEMVIRSGLVFRRERHIPYARIQNVDAVQNVLHRLLKVVEVRVETGGGQAPEATMSVLPFSAFLEMRARVFAERHPSGSGEQQAQPEVAAVEPPPAELLLDLPPKELLLCGFLENRGGVLIAAGFGLLWELGLIDRIMSRFGSQASNRRIVRDIARSLFDNAQIAFDRIALAVVAFVGLLLFVRMLSMVWAVVRLYGFRLSLAADDLRSEYGLLTRVAATIPLRRIQTLTIREGPLHRLFGRVAVRADTAGSQPRDGSGATDREWLAPILRRPALPAFVQHVLPDVEGFESLVWQAVSPRAFRREIKGWLVSSAIVQIVLLALLGTWSLLVAPLLLAWAVIGARKTIAHLGWAVTSDAVFFRAGWVWRRLSIVRLAKIQTVTLVTSPFDRRSAMARVRVDTAGVSELTRVDIPYLQQDVGQALHLHLAHEAAGRRFLW